MTRSACEKIAAGLNEALAVAQGNALPRLTKAQEKVLMWLPADSLARLDALRADGEGRAEVVARLIDHITLTRESAPAAENAP